MTDYLDRSGLTAPLEELGFNLVGYGCTTCIGNSGPLPPPISAAIEAEDLTVCSVLSGNRNFEGRIHPEVKMNYLASPPLCVAYALAGRMDLDLLEEPLGEGSDGEPVYLRDIWPSQEEVNAQIESAVESDMFRKSYGEVFEGDENWNALEVPEGDRYAWDGESTYVKRLPYFEGMPADAPDDFQRIEGARAIALLGDSVTTDHISPAGAIRKDTPGGRYLLDHGVEQRDFNSYGSRRGNHEVMMRGTFANVRLRNQLAPGTEGGYTQEGRRGAVHLRRRDGVPGRGRAAVRAGRQGVRLRLVARLGGQGPAAAGHPVRDRARATSASTAPTSSGWVCCRCSSPTARAPSRWASTGLETFDLEPLEDGARDAGREGHAGGRGEPIEFSARVRIDTPNEWLYYRNGGILHFVLRQLRARESG